MGIEGAPQGDAVRWYHFHHTRQFGDGGAVEEATFAEAHIGQQVTMATRLTGQHAGHVGPHHQPRDAGVTAEELVGNRDDADVAAPQRCDERGDDLCTELAGEHADGRIGPRAQAHADCAVGRLCR